MTAIWDDGTPKSQRNAFTMGMGDPDAWKSMVTYSRMSQAGTAAIERARAAGTDRSTLKGLDKRSDLSIPNKGRTPKPLSKTGRLREALKQHPMSSADLADLIGVDRKHCRALLKYDIDKGSIVVLSEFKPARYALAGVKA